MRAQPRRRKDVKDEPIFLRKTYEMINTCEDEHAAWNAAGDTFVIKDPDLFANEVIPRFFKREFTKTSPNPTHEGVVVYVSVVGPDGPFKVNIAKN